MHVKKKSRLTTKRIDTKNWITGYLLKDGVTGQHFIHAEGNSVNESDKVNEEGCLQFVAFEVDPKTVCYYTGCNDRNLQPIFEYDIANCHEKRGAAFFHCIVVWNQTKARFDVRTMGCNFPMTLEEIDAGISINPLDYEVIGNIFDNPDMVLRDEDFPPFV